MEQDPFAANPSRAPPPRPALRDVASSRSHLHPDWVMLDCYVCPMNGDDDSFGATLAEGLTSTGDRIRFAFRAAAPPAISRFYFDWQYSKRKWDDGIHYSRNPMVKAAHRNCILLWLAVPTDKFEVFNDDYFVYQAHPQSIMTRRTLKKLPPCSHEFGDHMGILCRDDLDFVVAHLGSVESSLNSVTAELCMLKQGHWKTMQLPICHDEGKGDELFWWQTNQVLPFRNFICWVDYLRGILFCDVFSRNPKLHYVSLPVEPHQCYTHPDDVTGPLEKYRSVCVTKDGVMKFVDVASRESWFSCSEDLSSSPFLISSWTLSDQRSNWAKEFTIEADKFWSLTNSMNLTQPHLEPELPLLNMKDPQIIYFLLRKIESSDDIKAFLIAVDTLRDTADVCIQYTLSSPETLLGSSSSKDGDRDTTSHNLYFYEPFISCEFSKYLNVSDTRKRKILG